MEKNQRERSKYTLELAVRLLPSPLSAFLRLYAVKEGPAEPVLVLPACRAIKQVSTINRDMARVLA